MFSIASNSGVPSAGSNCACIQRGHQASKSRDRLGVLVAAVAVAVDAVRAVGVPGAQASTAAGAASRAAEQPQRQRQDLVGAQVDGGGVLHRASTSSGSVALRAPRTSGATRSDSSCER